MVPPGKSNRVLIYCLLAAACWLMILAVSEKISAQQLPIRFYSVADGLPASWVSSVHQDSKGYIWISTGIGLSRFDGYQFRNYIAQQELKGEAFFSSIAEDREGRIWVGTIGAAGNVGVGVARVVDDSSEARSQPDAGQDAKLLVYRISDSPDSNTIYDILIDHNNYLWCFTLAGLYRADLKQSGNPVFQLLRSGNCVTGFIDRDDNLWLSIDRGLLRISRTGTVSQALSRRLHQDRIISITQDNQGRIFAANAREVFQMDVSPGEDPTARQVALLPHEILSLKAASDGELFIGTVLGLIKCRSDGGKLNTAVRVLSEYSVATLAEDRERNMWLATYGSGVGKLSRESVVSFTQKDGLPQKQIGGLYEDNKGKLYVRGMPNGFAKIGAEGVTPLPDYDRPFVVQQSFLRDRLGVWWYGSTKGVLHADLPSVEPGRDRKLSSISGLPNSSVRLVFEDAAGNIWVSLEPNYLFKISLDRQATAEHETLRAASFSSGVIQMLDDGRGNFWLCSHTQLAKWNGNKITLLDTSEGLPEMRPRSLFRDSRGWLWVGLRSRGVSMTKDPTSDHPHFVNYSTANGLVDDTVWSITEDNFGHVYLGTEKGLDQLDPLTGRVRHLTSKDGLAGDLVYRCIRDHLGKIWIATNGGVSVYDPRGEEIPKLPPPVYFSTILVAGKEMTLARGAQQLSQMGLASGENNLRIEFVGLSFLGDQAVRYQYKLEGVDADWSQPSQERTVNYALLTPGSYRFLVRAISREGVISPEPAAFAFRIAPPIWQRWWVLTLALMVVGLATYSFYRRRVARLIELERVRMRIATDLHDDIGSGLSQIAILSEVVSGKVSRNEVGSREVLSNIASTSRELVDSMSDIVWAIDPEKDHLSDLTQRMRIFASDALAGRDIDFSFREPDEQLDTKLGTDVRRQVFLIFKESVNNIVTHSGCTQAEINFSITDGWLSLRICDNGQGFNDTATYEGHGLTSIRSRADEIGGKLEIISSAGNGTVVNLLAPLRLRSHAPPSQVTT